MEVSPNCAAQNCRFSWFQVLIFAAALGPFCFLLNNLALWSGMLHPPAGFVPRYALSNLDIPIYLTWMTLAPTHWLLPNMHAPWANNDALFSPLVAGAGLFSQASGLSPITGFQIFHLIFYFVAAFALGALIWTFCPSRVQRIAAAIGIFAALPLPLLVLGWSRMAGKDSPVLWIGLVEYAYETADGLLRGGCSNSFTLSFGTAANLFGLVLLARYVRNRRPWDLTLLAITAFLSALFHPVEACVITAASIASFTILAWREGRGRVFCGCGVLVGASAALGLLPYVIQTSRSEWVRDISRMYQWQPSSVLWVPMVFGIPSVLAAYFLLMRFRLQTPGDEVLRTWFLTTVAMLFIPAVPFKLHMFDGFAYITAILLVRLVSGHVHLAWLVNHHPRLMYAVAAGAIGLSLPGYVTLYWQIWSDGRSGTPALLFNALAPEDEPALINWARHNLPMDQLVMAPLETAPWIATAPLPTLASHDHFSITYEQQSKFVADFYAGKLSDTEASAWLAYYGVHYVLLPRDSPGHRFLSDRKPVGTSGYWTIFELPDASRPIYPGLIALRPEFASKLDFGMILVQAGKIIQR